MRNLLFACAFLLALAGPLPALAGPPTVAVVRILDTGSNVNAFIVRGDGPPEKVDFYTGPADKRLAASAEGYQKLIQRMYAEGYTLQSTFSSTPYYTTLVFVKPA